MKPLTIPAILFIAALAFTGGRAAASFHDSPVRLEVKVHGGDRHDQIRGSSAMKHDQHEELEITISSVSRNPPLGLQAKWFIFGRDLKSNRVNVIRSGEEKVALGRNGSQVLNSAKVEAVSVPEHSVVSRGRGGKKVEATGDKYIGYGVQVLAGDTVVSETYYPVGIKQVAAMAAK